MSTDELTPAEVKAIVAEIDAWSVRVDRHPEDWRIDWIAHLWEIRQECYLVKYENDVATVFMRDELGALRPAGKYTYVAIDNFDRQKTVEAAQTKAEDTARRRTQGAKDGWEIRRAKQAPK